MKCDQAEWRILLDCMHNIPVYNYEHNNWENLNLAVIYHGQAIAVYLAIEKVRFYIAQIVSNEHSENILKLS